MLLVSGGSEHFTGRVARIATCMHMTQIQVFWLLCILTLTLLYITHVACLSTCTGQVYVYRPAWLGSPPMSDSLSSLTDI